MLNDNFSLTSMFINTSITLISSSTAAAFLTQYLTRPRPAALITSVGFTGSEEYIHIDDKLISLTEENPYFLPFRQYETYKRLESSHETLVRISKEMQIAIDGTQLWLQVNSLRDKNYTMTIEELLKTPYCTHNIVGTILSSYISRDEIPGDPPISIDELEKLPKIAPVIDNPKGYSVDLRKKSVLFLNEKCNTDTSKKVLRSLLSSYSRGSSANIIFFTKKFLEIAQKSLDPISRTISNIEDLMLPRAHLSVRVVFHNYGKKPITLKQYMGLKFEHEDLEDATIYLAVKHNNTKLEHGSQMDPKVNRGTNVQVEPFLPRQSEGQYIFLAPNSEIACELKSIGPLGKEEGRRVRDLFSANVLRCRLVAIRMDGKGVISPAVIFGENASKIEKNDIKKLIHSMS